MSVAQKGRSSSEDVDHRGQQLHGPPSRRSPASAARASSGLTEQRLVLHRPATYLQRPVARQISRRISSTRSEEHTSELQSLMRISYAVFCLKKKKNKQQITKYLTEDNRATQ